MSVITIGRLALGPPSQFVTEGVGDPVGAQGSAVVPATRTPLQIGLDLNTVLNGSSTLTAAQAVRRQLRSIMNNVPLKMQASFLYLMYTDDTEQNGWLVPQSANITSPDNNAWKAVGLWIVSGSQWSLAGRRRGAREARSVWMKDLRRGLLERDQLGMVLTTDFSALLAQPITILPHGAISVENAVNGQTVVPQPLPTGRDGGIAQLVAGPAATTNLLNPDSACLSFDRAETALNLSDVIAYDRRGGNDAPPTAPGPTWEEVYGPDYPWSWLDTGGAADCPVLDNGLVRVHYDSTGTPGFRVEVWNGALYVEQGKMCVQRVGDTTNFDNTWVSAGLVEWTPDRAVLLCVLSASADGYSRERIFITVQRGVPGLRFEGYPALTAAGNAADIVFLWTPALNSGVPDINNSIVKIDSLGLVSTTVAAGSNGVNVNTFTGAGVLNVASTTSFSSSGLITVPTSNGSTVLSYSGTTGTTFTGVSLVAGTVGGVASGTLSTGGAVAPSFPAGWSPAAPTAAQNAGSSPAAIAATAAGGGALFGGSTILGKSDFTGSEDWVALLRYPTAYNVIGGYQATLVPTQSGAQVSYSGTSSTAYGTNTDAYQVRSQSSAGYISCRVGFSSTQAQQVLEAESIALGTGTTSGADAAASGGTTTNTSRNADAIHVSQATWPNGFLATYRVFARVKVASGTGNFYAKTGATTGATVTCTSTGYAWVDLGDVVANNTTLEIHAWGSGQVVSVDRLEAVLVQDRTRTTPLWTGARDIGQAALLDSRTLGALTAR